MANIEKKMLTASNFGVICRMRATTFYTTAIKSIFFPLSIDTAAVKYGRTIK